MLVAAPGAADAAKPNPWSSYFPAKGVTCTSTSTNPDDGTTDSTSTTVVSKSAKSIVLRETGTGRFELRLKKRGRMQFHLAQTERSHGQRDRMTVMENYPSPAAALAHGSATGRMTMTMPMSARLAKAALTSGRTLTVTAKIHAVGVGSRTVTLADPAATTVDAIGVRTVISSFRVGRNAKPRFAHLFKSLMGSMVGSLSGTQWFAAGRGVVLDEVTLDGTTLTDTQTGCS